MTIFTEAEYVYLRGQELGRLATIGGNGPHNYPVWFRVNDDRATIDIGSIGLPRTQKYRDVLAEPRVSFVVDDVAPEPLWPNGDRGRGVEIRGRVQLTRVTVPLFPGSGDQVLRLHPRRVLAWNLDGPGYNSRNT